VTKVVCTINNSDNCITFLSVKIIIVIVSRGSLVFKALGYKPEGRGCETR
jgi:hypothetical protein